ncbi:MAG: hypothetical protein EHM64_11180 [Ignavibacteriae bacterium]|nr:MAG: hypothetical protein EHM64_11180 [Ignavibacteriota bacterium]
MKPGTIFSLIVTGMIAFVLTSCVPGGGEFHNNSPAGFLFGIWHGWIAPISLLISFFNPSVRIYEIQNTGFWYDFGFYIAIISGFGGISLTRKKMKSTHGN